MLLFYGFILGNITMLLILSPVLKAINKSIPPKHIHIDDDDLVFYDDELNDGE